MIEVIVSPCPRGRYRMTIDGKDRGISRTPLFTAARLLLREGVPPGTVLQMRHAGSLAPSMRGSIGKFAGLTVIENATRGPVIAPFRPFRGKPSDAV